MNKNNLKTLTSQQEIQDWDKKFQTLTQSDKLVANYYIATSNIRQSIFVSQTLVAIKLGISREQVNRSLKKLHVLGIITKIDRGWKEDRTRIKKTCYYILNKIFFYQEFRDKYKTIFVALSYLVIFSNFESIYGIKRKEQNHHQYGKVTGIKSSPNCLFINTHTKLRNCSITYQRSNVTKKDNLNFQQKKDHVVNTNSIIYQYSEFNDEAKRQLSVFPDKIHIEAIKIMQGKTDLVNPYGYYRGTCIKLCQKYNITYEQPDYRSEKAILTLPIRSKSTIRRSNSGVVVKKEEVKIKAAVDIREVPEFHLNDIEKESLRRKYKSTKACLFEAMERYDKTQDQVDQNWVNSYNQILNNMHAKYPYLFGEKQELKKPEHTPVYIANQISSILSHPVSSEQIGYRDAVIYNWSRTFYTKTGEENEQLAISYINKTREEFKIKKQVDPLMVISKQNPTPTQQITPQVVNTVDSRPVTSEIQPGCPTINEVDYDEVLD